MNGELCFLEESVGGSQVPTRFIENSTVLKTRKGEGREQLPMAGEEEPE